jgi:hypothetical protein
MATTASRPGLAAHTLAVRSTFPQVAAALRELLGPRLVAYMHDAVSKPVAAEDRDLRAVFARFGLSWTR